MSGLPISGGDVPALPRGVRLQFNEARAQWFLQGPERVFEPDEIAVEILTRIDGVRTVDAIARELAVEFSAPEAEIGADVASFVAELLAIRMLERREPAP
jgi:coenzyme PQQ biosynthesis protein PqqD